MEDKLDLYFTTLRNFSRLFMQNVVDDGKSIKSDLRLSQIRAIAAFKDKNCLSMNELANNIGVNLPTMTMMIKDLEASVELDSKALASVRGGDAGVFSANSIATAQNSLGGGLTVQNVESGLFSQNTAQDNDVNFEYNSTTVALGSFLGGGYYW